MRIFALAVVFVGAVSANFLAENSFSRFLGESTVAVTYNQSLPCGQCIRGGFNACFKGTTTKCC